MEKEKHAGQPPKFKCAEDLQEKIDEYKSYLERESKPPTIAGLAYYTGIDRQTIYNYKKKDEFFDTIKNFVDFIKMNYEEYAITDSSAGLIFLMKNYGYVDKVENDTKLSISKEEQLSDEELDKELESYMDD